MTFKVDLLCEPWFTLSKVLLISSGQGTHNHGKSWKKSCHGKVMETEENK